MRSVLLPEVDRARIRTGPYASTTADGYQGAFSFRRSSGQLNVIASDGRDWQECGLHPPIWEHVSVSCANRCPTWDEMKWIRSLFWDNSETVLQLHPPTDRYVNCHEYCLHLWKPVGVAIPLPPTSCIGPLGGAA